MVKEGKRMNYKEFKEKQQAEFNRLPIFFAFSDKQFEEALRKRGVDPKEAKGQVIRFGGGGFFLRKDLKEVRAWLDVDHDKELRDEMEKDPEFARDAFEYEMFNHEYPINWQGDWDVASCFGSVRYDEFKTGPDYLRELGFSDAVIGMWGVARRKVQTAIEW